MQQWRLLLIFLLFTDMVFAQDERYYRKMLTGQLPDLTNEYREGAVQRFNVDGPSYQVDLNGDGIEESIRPQKRDGVDWLEISDFSGRKVFAGKLLAMGANSAIFKIRLVSLSPNIKTMIIFLDEGTTRGKEFESTARIFLLSFERNDLSTMKMVQGPHFYQEKESQREQYIRRGYPVDVVDFDGDGVKEVIVHYGHIQRILRYDRNGDWRRL